MDWDRAESEWVGAVVLVGLTFLNKEGEIDRREQFYGQIVSAHREHGIELDLSGARGGESYWLPPDLEAFQPAARGDYSLESTGELVRDPDLVTQWTVQAPLDD
ncbi:hypothetical protein [Brevundimonas lenta]|uniref:Uncharacterized protein n=1 Tax=Brevundimonas lenta TaxID=424796 RepID=A0A7W6NQV0_9CAUL|nr:hypothetical protein [Brevundimonas lenta]MBB4083510.1 hypothetical protein [Brevundimonas lenta]